MLALLLQAASPPQDDVVVRAPPKSNAQTPATMVVEPAAMAIAAWDTDGDGLTTRAEMEAGVRRSFETIDTAKTGRLRYIVFADWAERYLGDRNALPSPFEVDRNGDDQITLPELDTQFARLFGRLDRNGDAAISRAEALTIRTVAADAKGPTGPRDPKRRDKPEATPERPRRR